jgi:Ser/Thr protein kinase RdoA (MazF antagonist)
VLAQEDVAQYLLGRGLLGPEALLDGDLVIRDASSRNRNFRVDTRNGPCYLLKQGLTADAVAAVAHEAQIYEQLGQEGAVLSPYLPKSHGYDPVAGVLALELVQDAEDLRMFNLRTGRFSAGPAAALGAALGTLHRSTTMPLASAPTLVPWILMVHRPDARLFREVSAAGLELIRIVQGAEGFPDALDRVRGSCRQEALVHGDVKWDNCLIIAREDGGEEIRLIDWESAAPGDPCWDIGSALSHYLSFWLFSIPVTGSTAPEQFPELAAYPLDAMKSALAACWVAYLDALGADERFLSDRLTHTVELAGARLVQTAYESAQMMQKLTSSALLHLQLALNILQRPADAAERLLGLAVRRPRAA